MNRTTPAPLAPPSPSKTRRSGCLAGCFLLVCALVAAGVMLSGSIRGAVRGFFADGPHGKLLAASMVQRTGASGVLWTMTDEGLYVLTTVKTPGRTSTGNRCYLFCQVVVTAVDTANGAVLLRDVLEDSGSPDRGATLHAEGSKVWAVLPRTEANPLILRSYDGGAAKVLQETAAIAAAHPDLSAGLLNAQLKLGPARLEISTTDGRVVDLPIAEVAATAEPAPPVRIFLAPESRRNKARMTLYRLVGGEGLPPAELASQAAAVASHLHSGHPEKAREQLRKHLERKQRGVRSASRRAQRLAGTALRLRQTASQMRARAAKMPGTAGERLRQMAAQIEARAAAMDPDVPAPDEPPAADESPTPDAEGTDEGGSAAAPNRGEPGDPAPLTLEAVSGDRVFLEAWVAYQDAESLVIVHQQTAGPRSARLISCLDGEGNLRWTLSPDQLPESLERDDKARPFSTPFLVQQRIKIRRHGDAMLLEIRPEQLRVLGSADGAVRYTLEL